MKKTLLYCSYIFFIITLFLNHSFAAIANSEIFLIGFRLDQNMIQNEERSLTLTYQNRGEEDFLGVVSISCGSTTIKKVADDKSILIFKNGGQETAILNIKVSEVGVDIPCLIVIKDRDGVVANSNNLSLQVIASENPKSDNAVNGNITNTNNYNLSSDASGDLESKLSVSNLYGIATSSLQSIVDRINIFLGRGVSTSSTSASVVASSSTNAENNPETKSPSESSTAISSSANPGSFSNQPLSSNHSSSTTSVFSKLSDIISPKNNVASYSPANPTSSSSTAIEQNTFTDLALNFLKSIFFAIYDFIGGLWVKLFLLFLPPFLALFIGRYWLAIILIFWILLLFKKRKKRILRTKRFDERYKRDKEVGYDDEDDDEDEAEDYDEENDQEENQDDYDERQREREKRKLNAKRIDNRF
jgi:hypothetical protein